MSKAKVVLRFDVFPGEKFDLELVCKSLGISKIEFLRRAIRETLKEIDKGDREC